MSAGESYTVLDYQFSPIKGRCVGGSYVTRSFTFSDNFGQSDTYIANEKRQAYDLLRTVFPAAADNISIDGSLIGGLNNADGMILVKPAVVSINRDEPILIEPKEEETAGVILYKKIANFSHDIYHITLVGVSPEHNGKSLTQTLTEQFIQEKNPDLILLETAHPGIFIAYQHAADNYAYKFYPREEECISTDIFTFAKNLVSVSSGYIYAEELDRQLVRRNLFPCSPQGAKPFIGFPYFEDVLSLAETDEVFLILVKEGKREAIAEELKKKDELYLNIFKSLGKRRQN